jgi:hypothetical protein
MGGDAADIDVRKVPFFKKREILNKLRKLHLYFRSQLMTHDSYIGG